MWSNDIIMLLLTMYCLRVLLCACVAGLIVHPEAYILLLIHTVFLLCRGRYLSSNDSLLISTEYYHSSCFLDLIEYSLKPFPFYSTIIDMVCVVVVV